MLAGMSCLVLEGGACDFLADGDGRRERLLGSVVAERVQEEFLAHGEALRLFLAQAGAVDEAGDDEADGELDDEVRVLGREDGEEQRDTTDAKGRSCGPHGRVVVVEEEEGRRGDATEPRQEPQRARPRPDRLAPPRDRPLAAHRYLHRIRADLDPVVDEHREGGDGPDDGEEGEVPYGQS